MKLRPRPVQEVAFRRSGADRWTEERIGRLSVPEIKQLQANAERLGESTLASLCTAALSTARRAQWALRRPIAPKPRSKLIPRSRAFQARGVWLSDPRRSWSGVRKSDGAVVMALWANDIVSADGGCSYLLWRPNRENERPWSDTPAGQERLTHCKQALGLGRAEGLLVHGESAEGRLPQERAHSVHGVDPEVVLALKVEQRGDDYWAVWGKSPS